MASRKLNKQIREMIQKRLLDAKFKEQFKELDKQRGQLALDVYDDRFRDIEKKMNNLPDGWLPETRHIDVQIGPSYLQLWFPDDVRKRVPSETRGCVAKYTAESEFARQYSEIKDTDSRLHEEKRQLKAEINAVLHSVTTVNRLLEEWPEITSTVNEVCRVLGRENLPAVRIESLNERLGLNSVEDATDTA